MSNGDIGMEETKQQCIYDAAVPSFNQHLAVASYLLYRPNSISHLTAGKKTNKPVSPFYAMSDLINVISVVADAFSVSALALP